MKFSIYLTTIIAIVAIVYLLVLLFEKFGAKKKDLSPNSIVMISTGLIGLTMSLLAGAIYYCKTLLENSEPKIDYSKVGPYGDLIGGIINPVIAFIGIIAASLAFYAQYKANQLIQEQFLIQKFESQFYEMLRMHRENLNEMVIEGYKYDYKKHGKKVISESKKDKITSGKKIFVTLIKEFEAIHTIFKKIFYQYHSFPQSAEANQLIFDHSYYVFLNGVVIYRNNVERYVDKDETGLLSQKLLLDYIKELKRIRRKHEDGCKHHSNYFQSRTLFLSFNFKPFSGHQSLLAHYYRQLIQTVKFVIKQDDILLPYENKRDYLRILRAILSNHEQVLLYYNWLSGFGSSWEKKLEDYHLNKDYNTHNNKFFTDYRMIHNIPDDLIIEEFKLVKTFDPRYHQFLYEKDRKDNDTLFEITGIISLKK